MFKIPFGTKRASERIVKFLLRIGALFTDESGIHASEPGIYPKTKKIPTQTANQGGDNK